MFFMPKDTRWNSFSYLDGEMFYREEEMFFDRPAPFFRNIKCSVRNVGGARTGGRGASLFGGSHAETPAEVKPHDFN